MLQAQKSTFLPQVALRSSSCFAVAHGGSPTRKACHPVKGKRMEPKSQAEGVPCLGRRHHHETAVFVVVEFSLLLERGPGRTLNDRGQLCTESLSASLLFKFQAASSR